MLNCFNEIVIQQIPNADFPNRNAIIEMYNIMEFKVSNSNEDLVQTAEFVISRKTKNVWKYESEWNYNDILNPPFNKKNTKGSLYKLTNNDFVGMGLGNDLQSVEQRIEGAKILNRTYTNPRPPLFVYGDMIKIYSGYTYYDNDGIQRSTFDEGNKGDGYTDDTDVFVSLSPQEKATDLVLLDRQRSLLFTGYITSISSQFDIRVKCQDYMQFFFQFMAPDVNILSTNTNLSISKPTDGVSYEYGTLQGGLLGLLDGINGYDVPSLSFTAAPQNLSNFIQNYKAAKLKSVYNYGDMLIDDDAGVVIIKEVSDSFILEFNNTTSDDRFGDLKGEHFTIGDWLKQIKDDGWANVFFYPNTPTLNISIFKYNHDPYDVIENPTGYQKFTFTFQENIIHNKLEYKRTDTLLKAAIVKSTFTVNKNNTNINGVDSNTTPDNTTPITVFVGTPGGITYTFIYGRKSIALPLNQKELDKIIEDMRKWGERKLADTYYEGYYGSITIFGYPYIKHGDQITIIDKNYPERDGAYMCNKVIYTGTHKGGLKQEVFIGEKITKRTYNTTI